MKVVLSISLAFGVMLGSFLVGVLAKDLVDQYVARRVAPIQEALQQHAQAINNQAKALESLAEEEEGK